MANNAAGFYETLLSSIDEFNESVKGQTALLDGVYQNVTPDVARIGHTIQIPFPDLGNFSDQGANDVTTTDIDSSNTKSLTFTACPRKAILVRDFEQYQTAQNIIKLYVRPMYQRAQEYLNGVLCSLVTTTKFNAFAPIIGANQGKIVPEDTLAAWSNLSDAKAPMDDPTDLSLFCHNAVYRKMLGDAQYNQESIVSAMVAQEARQLGEIANTFRFRPKWDQQMPTSSATVIQGTVTVTNGSATVTGIATSFSTDLTTSNYVVFGSDPTKTQYSISSIGSDTTLTLGSNYSGTTTAGTTLKKQTKLAGTVTVTNGSATVTGSGTAFTTALNVGDWIRVAVDTTNTHYQVLAIASDTSLTLTGPYGGTGGSGTTATVATHTCVAMHRYAIGLALRNLPSPEESGLPFPGKWSYVVLGGIPCRLMMTYQHRNAGVLLSVDFGYAADVIRPTFGQIIKV